MFDSPQWPYMVATEYDLDTGRVAVAFLPSEEAFDRESQSTGL